MCIDCFFLLLNNYSQTGCNQVCESFKSIFLKAFHSARETVLYILDMKLAGF